MRYFIILIGLLLFGAGSNNLILNPNYQQGFDYWENTDWSLGETKIGTVAKITLKGTSRQLCTRTYPNNGNQLKIGVTFKSNKPGNQYIAGTGYGSFLVKWYEDTNTWEESFILTDATLKGTFVRKYFQVKNTEAKTFQICVKSVAYQNKVFSLAVTNWVAKQ